MNYYFITNTNPGFGNDPVLLGAAHTTFPAYSHGEWIAEKTTLAAIQEYEKHNGAIKWFDCEHCLNQFQSAAPKPIVCGHCGHESK